MKCHVPMLILLLVAVAVSCWAQPPTGLVDPLRPATYQRQSHPEPLGARESIEELRDRFKVSSILIAKDRAVAVINGQPLQVGQLVQEYRLTEIEADHVILQKDSRRVILQRPTGTIKKSSPQ